MKLVNVSVVPAQPGHELIYAKEETGNTTYEVWGHVIAWRVSTWQLDGGENEDSLQSHVEALDYHGQVANECIGVKNPDGSVEIFMSGSYRSFEAFLEAHKQG